MYELGREKAESLLNEADHKEESREQHYLFADNSLERLQQMEEFYSIILGEECPRMLHIRGDFKNTETGIETSEVVSALKNEGYRPFLKLDISRYFLEHKGKEISLEKVQNLGYFVDDEDMGGRKAFYADILLEKMQSDSESRQQVIKEAKEIL